MILAQLNQVLFRVTAGNALSSIVLTIGCLLVGIIFVRRKLQKQVAATEVQLRRQAAFSDLGHRLSSASTQKEAGDVILQSAQELFGWEAAIIQLYDLKSGATRTVVYADTVEGKQIETGLPPDEKGITPMMRKVFEEGP